MTPYHTIKIIKQKTPIEWHNERLNFGVNARKDYNFAYIHEDTNSPFTNYWDIDCWFCKFENSWLPVTETPLKFGRAGSLMCNSCRNTIAILKTNY